MTSSKTWERHSRTGAFHRRRHALQLGYVDLLDKAYDDIQFVWLHLYQLRKAINDDMLAERTIDADPEVTADDLPFDGKEEKE